jgi:hypothetical protein
VAKDRISKTSHGFARNFADASQDVLRPCSRWLTAKHLETTRMEWGNDGRSLGKQSVSFRLLSGILSQSSADRIISDLSLETIASAVGSALR